MTAIKNFLFEHYMSLCGAAFLIGVARGCLEGYLSERTARRNFEKYQQIGENLDAGLQAGLHAGEEAEK